MFNKFKSCMCKIKKFKHTENLFNIYNVISAFIWIMISVLLLLILIGVFSIGLANSNITSTDNPISITTDDYIIPVTITTIETNSTIINSKEYKRLLNLNEKEKEVLFKSLEYGEERGIVLAAIAWQETQFGNNIINKNDGKHGSYGVYQIQLEYADKRNPKIERDIVKKKLLNNMKFQAKEALAVLDGFNKNKELDTHTLLKRYNGGYSNSKRSHRYAEKVIWKIKVLEEYLKHVEYEPILASL